MGIAAAALGAGVLGAGASIYAADTAASAQKSAADQASQTQTNMFNKMQTNLSPYMAAGTNANSELAAQLPGLTSPINMTEANLEKTPGYQFNLTQGLKSTQSGAAARGLGISGAALKGAATYATGLADNTYQNQFNNANTNRTFALNALTGQQSVGENAAAGVGNAGVATGNQIASNQLGAGNASAAASIATGNAVGSAGSSALQGYTLQNLLQGNNSSYFNSTGNYQGMTDAQQDALQDSGFALPG